ncbi:MAG: hypothetical protein HY814_07595 [Candidatus Riflebacteria bacterium]|nr:hypothetical protein [Candidatus Riflebacteria bacterium]
MNSGFRRWLLVPLVPALLPETVWACPGCSAHANILGLWSFLAAAFLLVSLLAAAGFKAAAFAGSTKTAGPHVKWWLARAGTSLGALFLLMAANVSMGSVFSEVFRDLYTPAEKVAAHTGWVLLVLMCWLVAVAVLVPAAAPGRFRPGPVRLTLASLATALVVIPGLSSDLHVFTSLGLYVLLPLAPYAYWRCRVGREPSLMRRMADWKLTAVPVTAFVLFLGCFAMPGTAAARALLTAVGYLLSLGGVLSVVSLGVGELRLRRRPPIAGGPGAESGPLAVHPEKGLCPVCGEPVGEAPVLCQSCQVPHHEMCWRYTGRCAVYGCGTPDASRLAG